MARRTPRLGISNAIGAGGLLALAAIAALLAVALRSPQGGTAEDGPVSGERAEADALPGTPLHFTLLQDPAALKAMAYSASPMTLVGGQAGAAGAQVAGFATPTPVMTKPQFKMIPFVEAHWQGLEMIELSPALARALGFDPNLKGIVADDVTPPADACKFQGGDVVLSIEGVATPDLLTFIAASNRVRGQASAELSVRRKGQVFPLVLWALGGRLGVANGETAPMIPSGSVSPHAYQGKCTGCHRIGTTGQLPVDQGDLLAKAAPVIRGGQPRPHRDRGSCAICHTILP